MTSGRRVLVTGAEEHQGLAVIRGLGMAGIDVIACGTSAGCLGHRSRYATQCFTYTSPVDDAPRFAAEIIRIARRTDAALIMPAVETTLVALNNVRARVDAVATLGAAPPEVLDLALDKCRTVALARTVGVPVPRTASAPTVGELIAASRALTFPVAIKPRGNGLHAVTANRVPFKSRYARTLGELITLLEAHAADARALLVQEYATGTGRCVAAVCRHGEPLAMFAYDRLREFPLTGGVSVVRRSRPLDDELRHHTEALLRAARWHGVAMVEFKFDEGSARHVLMEVNARFQASTALCLDAGLNLPLLAACLHAGWTLPAPAGYRPGVTERWLRGDLLALRDALPRPRANAVGIAPSIRTVVAQFLGDFRTGIHFDEYRRDDPAPALAEAATIGRMLAAWAVEFVRRVARFALTSPLRIRTTTLRRAD